MSEHRAPRTGARVEVTLRSKAREIMFSRLRRGLLTVVPLTPGSRRWGQFESFASVDPKTLDRFYTLHGKPPKRKVR